MLRIEGLRCLAGGKPVIQEITTGFAPGMLHVIVGPNGSGKSTFLKAFSGEWPLAAGEITYDGEPLRQLTPTALSRRRAVMSQLPELHFPLRVDDIVMMGRYPHFSFRPSRHDTGICRAAMERLSILNLAARDYLTLSGGERQRVQFARALTQIWDPPDKGSRYLFLDEPVSSLDIRYQHQLLESVRVLVGQNIVIVAILHDLNLALQYADRILFLKEGRIAAEGPAPEVVRPELIREVFGVESHVLQNPFGPQPVIVYG
ncbi:MAG TPA: heme ABC transporter ATP-binding protein [Puia sp.]|jgi:iron complex transport system ATP-binding protein|nr:heme ABC transporter ATP-binding protein [Puia sp.]